MSSLGRWRVGLAIICLVGSAGVANAEGLGSSPTLPLAVEQPKRFLIDFHHIERNASFTVLAAAYAFNENFLGYFSWDTDDDGVIGGLYINDFANNFNVIGGLVLNDKKAGNHSIMGLTHVNYVVGNASIGVGLQLERGLDTKVANTIGKQNTLTYRIIGEYTFPKAILEIIAEKYDYRNSTYRDFNRTIPDRDTSTAGKSAATFELTYTGFGDIYPVRAAQTKGVRRSAGRRRIKSRVSLAILSSRKYQASAQKEYVTPSDHM